MAESEESLQLTRRARRRLVGAVALVTFVVIILPLLLDKEPGPAGPPLDVQIPRPESGGLTSRVGPPAVQPPVASPAPASEKMAEAPPAKPGSPVANGDAVAAKAPPPAARNEPAVAKAGTATATPAPAAVDKSAALPARTGGNGEQAQAATHEDAWVVALDAFSDAKNVKQLRTKLSAAGVKSYTEAVQTSKGELTRVRAGPFDSKEAAEKARAKLVAMGLKPGAVVSR